MTRAGEIAMDGGAVDLPPAPHTALLVSHLTECGLSREGMAGRSPLTAQELAAWAAGTDTQLGPIDFQGILDASRAYVAAVQEFDTVMIGSPWAPEMSDEEEADHLAAQERLFDMMMGVTDGS